MLQGHIDAFRAGIARERGNALHGKPHDALQGDTLERSQAGNHLQAFATLHPAPHVKVRIPLPCLPCRSCPQFGRECSARFADPLQKRPLRAVDCAPLPDDVAVLDEGKRRLALVPVRLQLPTVDVPRSPSPDASNALFSDFVPLLLGGGVVRPLRYHISNCTPPVRRHRRNAWCRRFRFFALVADTLQPPCLFPLFRALPLLLVKRSLLSCSPLRSIFALAFVAGPMHVLRPSSVKWRQSFDERKLGEVAAKPPRRHHSCGRTRTQASLLQSR
mmetsp:Transcript_38525/g.79019  ORF Transcript_38525/g.79019 Transcript_38525/m.79019 type:complete len:274 (+) Transcript_38525:604-1425(+)